MSSIASISTQDTREIRFYIDNVRPTRILLSTQSGKSQLEHRFNCKLLTFSHNNDNVQLIQNDYHIHPLALAVHHAFSEHRPLQLTPDIIWITLVQGFAQHVNNNSESLRTRFVEHEGQKTLKSELFEFPKHPQAWEEIIQEWSSLMDGVISRFTVIQQTCFRLPIFIQQHISMAGSTSSDIRTSSLTIEHMSTD